MEWTGWLRVSIYETEDAQQMFDKVISAERDKKKQKKTRAGNELK